MPRPFHYRYKIHRNHDAWYERNNHKFRKPSKLSRYQSFEDGEIVYDRIDQGKARKWYRFEITNRVSDILAKSYGIYTVDKRKMFNNILPVLDSRLTPSQAAWNIFESMRQDGEL